MQKFLGCSADCCKCGPFIGRQDVSWLELLEMTCSVYNTAHIYEETPVDMFSEGFGCTRGRHVRVQRDHVM